MLKRVARAIITRIRRYWLTRQKHLSDTRVLSKATKMPIVPTYFGLAMLVVLVVMFIWSANHQLNLGYFLTFLVATLVMLSASLTVSHLANLSVKVVKAPAVFLGDEARYHLVISEQNGRDRAGFWVKNAWGQECVSGIKANSQVEVIVKEPTMIRGWQTLSDLEISTTLPLGFFVSWQWFYLDKKLLVYPAPLGDLPLPYEVNAEQGSEDSNADYGDDEFAGLKTYTLGDSLSRVAWKQSGRGGDLMLKIFHGQGAKTLVLDYGHLKGGVETRLSQLTKWVLSAEQARLPYALVLPNRRIEKGLGEAHRTLCLQTLALFNK